MGSMNKVEKLFLVPMVMAVAVKIMAMAATIAPVVNATGIARTARGGAIRPKANAITNTAIPASVAWLAGQSTYPK